MTKTRETKRPPNYRVVDQDDLDDPDWHEVRAWSAENAARQTIEQLFHNSDYYERGADAKVVLVVETLDGSEERQLVGCTWEYEPVFYTYEVEA